MSDLIQWLIALSFAVVSFALTAKFLIESYLDYIQVKTGIRVVTQKQVEEYMRQMEEEGEDEDTL